MQKKSVRYDEIISLVFLFFAFLCSSAQAIGPYSVGNSTVIDQGTGLEWQKNDTAAIDTWENGLAYCEQLSLNSKTDWRLPNIRELKSLVDYDKYYPAVDPAIPCRSISYWSSTSVINNPSTKAWSVFFGNGDDIWKSKTEKFAVRCVRGGLSGD